MKKFLDLNDVSGSGVGTRLEGEEGVLFDLTLFVHRLDDLESNVDGRLLAWKEGEKVRRLKKRQRRREKERTNPKTRDRGREQHNDKRETLRDLPLVP